MTKCGFEPQIISVSNFHKHRVVLIACSCIGTSHTHCTFALVLILYTDVSHTECGPSVCVCLSAHRTGLFPQSQCSGQQWKGS